MTATTESLVRLISRALPGVVLLGYATFGMAQEVPIVQT